MVQSFREDDGTVTSGGEWRGGVEGGCCPGCDRRDKGRGYRGKRDQQFV